MGRLDAETAGDHRLSATWDIVVIGGGNAALVSAMSAHDHGARVLVLERTDVKIRGGNSRHTRNIRCVHNSSSTYNTGAYRFEELWKDLRGVGTGPSNEYLAELTVRESESAPDWMTQHGARFQPPLTGTLHLGRTNRFFLGGGKALLNSYYRTLEREGIPVLYDALVEELLFVGNKCTELVVTYAGRRHRLRAASVIAASAGFEGNIQWLSQYWGDAANNFHIRGSKHNDGAILRALFEAGVRKAGQERGFHAVAVDARSPKFDGGIATRLDCIPFGIVLNNREERFYDEGEDIWPKRYAIWGKNICEQPDQIAFCFWDSTVQGLFLPPMYGVYSAPTIEEVALQMGLDPQRSRATVEHYNASVGEKARARFSPADLDGVSTTGVSPPKSNWAQPIDTPPYFGIAMRPGITFTYMGVEVDEYARVQLEDGSSLDNVFAAGEIMSGNVLSSGYLAGFGMTIGTVWGRIAGREAAKHVLR